jgi:hypothetical protein
MSTGQNVITHVIFLMQWGCKQDEMHVIRMLYWCSENGGFLVLKRMPSLPLHVWSELARLAVLFKLIEWV